MEWASVGLCFTRGACNEFSPLASQVIPLPSPPSLAKTALCGVPHPDSWPLASCWVGLWVCKRPGGTRGRVVSCSCSSLWRPLVGPWRPTLRAPRVPSAWQWKQPPLLLAGGTSPPLGGRPSPAHASVPHSSTPLCSVKPPEYAFRFHTTLNLQVHLHLQPRGEGSGIWL